MAFFIDFFGFCIDLGSILTRFWKDFERICRIFLKSADLQNSCAHAVFRKGRALENSKTKSKNSIQNRCYFSMWKKKLQNCSKNGFGRVSGAIWEGFGQSGVSFGRSWALPGRFLGVQNRSFFQHGSKMGSKRAFGSILSRFWKGLERI